jgi:RecA/RadA recombinase
VSKSVLYFKEKKENLMKKSDLIKSIGKATGAESVDKSAIAKVTEYFDTGSLALNRVLSGDLKNGGIPRGRVVTFFGASGSGKSLIAATTAAKALVEGKIDVVYIFDSEGGSLINVFKQHGADLNKVMYVPV